MQVFRSPVIPSDSDSTLPALKLLDEWVCGGYTAFNVRYHDSGYCSPAVPP